MARTKVTWVPGRGPQSKQGDFRRVKKKGAAYYRDASWPFLKKNAPRLRIVVLWNVDGTGRGWERQTFAPDALVAAKHFAKVTAQEGWDAEVFGEAYGFSSVRSGMEMIRVFSFGEYQ